MRSFLVALDFRQFSLYDGQVDGDNGKGKAVVGHEVGDGLVKQVRLYDVDFHLILSFPAGMARPFGLISRLYQLGNDGPAGISIRIIIILLL